MFFKKIFRVLPVIIAGILIVTAGVFAWTEPSASPPGGNIAAPINVSGIGQIKSGLLGIGTDGYDASYNLTVGWSGNKKGIKITGNSFIEGLTRLYAPIGTGGPVLRFYYEDLSKGFITPESGRLVVAADNGRDLTLQTYYSNAYQDRMTVKADGKVGIGETDPQYRLVVNGVMQTVPVDLPAGQEPTGSAGAIYYNNYDKKFRCFQDGQWRNCLGTATSGTNYWTASGNNIYNNNTGNVGIGTTSPSEILTVQKANDSSFLGLSGASGSFVDIAIGRTAGEVRLGIAAGVNQYATGSVAGDAILRVDDQNKKLHLSAGPGAATMTITSGNVGIGTASPQERLDVKGKILASDSLWLNNATADSPELGFVSSSGNYSIDDYYGTLKFTSGQGVKMVIGQDGNVGIGTTNPGAKLDVIGSAIVDYLRVDPTDTTNEGGEINLKGAGAYPEWFIDVYQNKLRVHSGGIGRLAIDQTTGNVGIGTTSPKVKLDVQGKITANGQNFYSVPMDPNAGSRKGAPGTSADWPFLSELHTECKGDRLFTTGNSLLSCIAACNRFCGGLSGSSPWWTGVKNENGERIGYSGGVFVEGIADLQGYGPYGGCLCSP